MHSLLFDEVPGNLYIFYSSAVSTYSYHQLKQLMIANLLYDACSAVIEKYTKSTRFALICNHVNKIIPALQSRCTRFRFAPLDEIHVSERLKHVIAAEG